MEFNSVDLAYKYFLSAASNNYPKSTFSVNSKVVRVVTKGFSDDTYNILSMLGKAIVYVSCNKKYCDEADKIFKMFLEKEDNIQNTKNLSVK